MGEGAVGSVLDAEASVVGVMDAHPSLVILEVITSLGVAGGAVEQRAPES
jgi:hypothetical protein